MQNKIRIYRGSASPLLVLWKKKSKYFSAVCRARKTLARALLVIAPDHDRLPTLPPRLSTLDYPALAYRFRRFADSTVTPLSNMANCVASISSTLDSSAARSSSKVPLSSRL